MDVLSKIGHFKNVHFPKMATQILSTKTCYIYKLKCGLKEQTSKN